MSEWFELSEPWWHFAGRGVLTYLGLLVLMRLAGKRSFGEMSAFDVLVIVLAGGTLRTAIIGDDHSYLGAFIGVASILVTNKALGWVCTRFPWFNRLVEGMPAILVRDGRRDEAELRRQSVPDAAFNRALHAAGMEHEGSVVIARLEPNGKITFVRREDASVPGPG
ncbi:MULTISPECIES: YetF domain-containing protein [unclassified Luteibacter]|uniref:DUF421 domain-containing protein n=1 Tax=unclassified Luteibacter TaxID=2620188 RepID=UPI0008AC4DFD|nr:MULTISPECIES: YetF domain-containing protein [unclassified Luteibacter]MDR6935884.1 uncharacterized membrane protein YcaP (DUF421 family) [Luteibacter sp. 3190]SEV90942.1 Uncharacterized membrane protein YcaP, DUF421 family [Luteibacter sp. 329MFSha]